MFGFNFSLAIDLGNFPIYMSQKGTQSVTQFFILVNEKVVFFQKMLIKCQILNSVCNTYNF